MQPVKKQWCLLISLVAGIVGGVALLWQATGKSEYFGDYGLLVLGPSLAAAGGGVGLVSAGLMAFVLRLVRTSEGSRRGYLSGASSVLLGLSILCVLAGAILSLTPMGWGYGIWISRLQYRQAETQIERILKLDDQRAVAELQRLIRHGRPAAKVRAANELCKFGDKSLVALDDMLDLIFGVYGTRLGGYTVGHYPRFIMECGPKSAPLIGRLTKALAEPPNITDGEWQRLQLVEYSANVLAAIGPAAETAMEHLEQVAMSDPVPSNFISSEQARGAAIRGLRSIGAGCDVFERLLESQHDDVRYQAMLHLELRCSDRLPSRLEKLLNDASPEVRQRALLLLVQHDSERALQPLVDATKDNDVWVRVVALNQLREHHPNHVTDEMSKSSVAELRYMLLAGRVHFLSQIQAGRALAFLYESDASAAKESAVSLLASERYCEIAEKFLASLDGRSNADAN